MKLPVYSTRLLKFRPPVLRSFEDTIMMRYIYLPTKVIEQALIVVPTLEKELVFIYRHVGQSICLHRFSMGRSYVAPSTHHPSTSQALNNIRTVSGYDLLLHITLHLTYCVLSILVDILRILSSSGRRPVEISDDAIDRRLDDVLIQFQV